MGQEKNVSSESLVKICMRNVFFLCDIVLFLNIFCSKVYGFVQLLFGRGQVRMGFFFCNILSFCWHLLHSYHCLERPSQVSIYFVYCCSERPSQVKRVFSSFLATFSILFFRSNIFPLFRCTYLKIVVWLDNIK